MKRELLTWARESIGLPLKSAAKRIGVKESELAAWEDGRAAPSVAQLRDAAVAYKRPLAAFFLPRPPKEPPAVRDYRGRPDRERDLTPELRLELRRAHRRRRVAIELASAVDRGIKPLDVTISRNTPISEAAARGRTFLRVDLVTQLSWSSRDYALEHWISAFEAVDVLVFQASGITVAEFRGFSIAEDSLPTIVLNGADKKRGRIFTLMHELAHLMLRESGVCDFSERKRNRESDADIETYCNAVAGELLVPGDALLREMAVRVATRGSTWSDRQLALLASKFSVSKEVILRRLLALGRTNQDHYDEHRALFVAEYARLDADKPAGGGPGYLDLAVRNNGTEYTRLVLDALHKSQITTADVSDYLGIALKHLDKLEGLVHAS